MEEPSRCKNIGIIGCGWLGLPLALRLKQAGQQILGTTRSAAKLREIEALGLNMLQLDFAQEIIPPAGCFKELEVCFLNIPPKRIEPETYAQNCSKIVHLLPKTCQVIFASSTGVYRDNCETINEDTNDANNFLTDHPVRQAEVRLQKELGERLTIVRFSGLIGANRHPARFLSGKTELAAGLNPVNLIQLDDCIRLIEKIISKTAHGGVFHGCFDAHPSRSDYYTEACRTFSLPLPQFKNEKTAWKIIANEQTQARLDFQFLHPI